MSDERKFLEVYRTEEAKKYDMPKFETDGSGAFDIRISLEANKRVKMIYDDGNIRYGRPNGEGELHIEPDCKLAVIPTGLFFKIPERKVLLAYIRSGISLNRGISLSNGCGIIDSDYRGEFHAIFIFNLTKSTILKDGDRMIQCRIDDVQKGVIEELGEKFVGGERGEGGLGSTGN